MGFDIVETTRAFQADDEGSIPFTRSNYFKDLSLIKADAEASRLTKG
jgi:hypothetical protein